MVFIASYHGNAIFKVMLSPQYIYFLNFALLSLNDDQYSCKTYVVSVNGHGKILDGENFEEFGE